MGFSTVIKYILYLIPVIIAILLGFYHKRQDFSIHTSVEINKTTREKVCGLLKNLKFLRFHPCVKEFKFLEKVNITNTHYDVYEVKEEAELFMGLYKFQTKNRLYVEKIDDCKIKTQVRMPIMSLFEAQFTGVFYAEEIQKDKFMFIEEGKISGIYYAIAVVREYTKFYHDILFEKIKIFLESQNYKEE